MKEDYYSDKIQKLAQIINESDKIVFFGGAGVSTESGIPDFRSKDGLYNVPAVNFEKYAPEYLLSHSCLVKEPEVFFEFYRQKMDCRNVEPNFAHKFLAKLGEVKDVSVVTQNIDGLHTKAGSKVVWEIHGTETQCRCVNCGKEFGMEYPFEHPGVPKCDRCGGTVRPKVVLYEERLDNCEVEGAIADIRTADTMIIAGTSLAVYPANTFISYFQGKHIVVIDKSDINMTGRVIFNPDTDLKIIGKVGEVFQEVDKLVNYEDGKKHTRYSILTD